MSKEKPKNLLASIRQRLLNLAREKNDDFQLVLIRYGVERLLYRISVSKYSGEFILKGAMLFQLWTGQPHRSTMDVDLLGSGDDDTERLVKLFQEVCAEVVEDDGLTFVSSSVQGEQIREEHRYGGIRVRLKAKLGNVRIPIQIDIKLQRALPRVRVNRIRLRHPRPRREHERCGRRIGHPPQRPRSLKRWG